MIGPKTPKPSKAQERAAYEAVTVRDGGKCVRCGWYGTVHRDHRQNRQRGNTVVSNLQCLCPTHHRWKTEHPAQALEEGFAVPRWVETSRIGFWPAWRWDVGSWVVYFDAPDRRGRWWDEITETTADMLRKGHA